MPVRGIRSFRRQEHHSIPKADARHQRGPPGTDKTSFSVYPDRSRSLLPNYAGAGGRRKTPSRCTTDPTSVGSLHFERLTGWFTERQSKT